MTDSKIFFDTAPFIYLLEDHPEYYTKVNNFINQVSFDSIFETSVISYMEFCVKPFKNERFELIDDLNNLLKSLNCKPTEISLEIAETAYKFRAKYKFLKGMDSLQIATAFNKKCNIFLSNDIPLKQIEEIKVVIISDL